MGSITMDFKEIYLVFTRDSHTHTLKGIQADSLEIIIFHQMEKLLKKGHFGIISHCHDIQNFDNTTLEIHPDLQSVLDKHQKIFGTPKGLPLSPRENDHGIPLILGSQPSNVHPYRHSFVQNNEIENISHELQEAGGICPNTSSYSSPMGTILQK